MRTMQDQAGFIERWNRAVTIRALAREAKYPAIEDRGIAAGESSWREVFTSPAAAVDLIELLRVRLGYQLPPAPALAGDGLRRQARVIVRGVVGVVEQLGHESNVGDLIETARSLDLDQIWLPPRMMRAMGLPGEPGGEHEWLTAAADLYDVRPAKLAGWLYGWSRADRGGVYVVLPAFDPFLGPRFRNATAGAIADVLALYAGKVGTCYRRSPGATGAAMMNLDRLACTGSPAPAVNPRQEIDFQFVRRPTRVEARSRWLHGYDVNGQYLAAASSVACGIGPPEHVEAPVFDPRIPGYWRATIRGRFERCLPHPTASQVRGRRQLWHSTPTIALASSCGDVEIREAWVWPEHRRALSSWYEHLRDARADLIGDPSEAAGTALDIIKATYRVSLGWLAGQFHEAEGPGFRPQWRHAVIATARANLYRRMVAIGAASGRFPVAVDVDALYYVSDGPNPLDAPAGLTIGLGLGEFRCLGSAPLAGAIPLFDVERPAHALRAVRALVAAG